MLTYLFPQQIYPDGVHLVSLVEQQQAPMSTNVCVFYSIGRGLNIDIKVVEKEEEFRYLRVLFTSEGRTEGEIDRHHLQ